MAPTSRRARNTVYVVSPDERTRRTYARMLVRHGFEVASASGPDEIPGGTRSADLAAALVDPGKAPNPEALARETSSKLPSAPLILVGIPRPTRRVPRDRLLTRTLAWLDKPVEPALLVEATHLAAGP